MKVTKKILQTEGNYVRPYRSRSERPCDFCRTRKTCCIIENLIPCMACTKFNDGQCTFLQKPLKRNRENTIAIRKPPKQIRSKAGDNIDVLQHTPLLRFTSSLPADSSTDSQLGFDEIHELLSTKSLLWEKAERCARSSSTGNAHSSFYNILQNLLDILPQHPPDASLAPNSYKHLPGITKEDIFCAIQESNDIVTLPETRLHYQSTQSQPRDYKYLENPSSNNPQHCNPHQLEQSEFSSETPTLLDNSVFSLLALGSNSGSRAWIPQAFNPTYALVDSGNTESYGARCFSVNQLQDLLVAASYPTQFHQEYCERFTDGAGDVSGISTLNSFH
ncbi:hypothetical protein METBIDRAFT_33424 [Metschnikowia bicuspidata var. bicuspidata NRRL YB-4993]|uniref:Zn(2)-C6 fungal-type domain-containing protein n=1 Tax=Metschnikowia bicuspidata var. bicuspidata NRRL YB-4993 TaxID=869754 RepID=A0A1A0H5M3_9ASCO|nr:hypothetical protein METBIDRAFT_33424 [Metschnikowia bicuspidata var. bicuspidata NRRL YB-4993]OBA19218.1 hypothetical protein METBIDRAFT_33424 [Metschnikowia bicuspidata var. bicuspidata NRRL YB-4993]